MENKLATIATNETAKLEDLKIKDGLQNFQKALHKQPPKDEIMVNTHAGNSNYIPISFVEMKLDEMFFGLWQTKNFTTKIVANEIIGEIELHYFHPVARMWLCRIGAAGTMIQYVSKAKGGSGDITNVRDKIPNTLVKDYPHLKAECIKNAARTLGKWFGRDLNRELEDKYEPFNIIIPQELTQQQIEMLDLLKITIDDFTDVFELTKKSSGILQDFINKGLDELTIKKEISEKIKGLKSDARI